MTWMPTANLDAQCAHFFVAMWVMAQCRDWRWRWPWAAGIVVVFALVKEFGFDYWVEHDSTWGSARDACFYGIGMAVGYFLQVWTGGWKSQGRCREGEQDARRTD